MSTTWIDIASDLRKAMIAAGMTEHVIATTLTALEPVARAIERAGTKIDIELAWALLAVQADRQRRRAVHARLRKAS